jgi:cytochrome bd-I ubiquinol oxidase subunit X
MWYFAWVLGAGFACTFGILNAMWLEVHAQGQDEKDPGSASP